MDKKELRKILREKRRSIPKEQKDKYNKAISEKIIASDYFKKAEQVLVFASSGEEFDTRYIIERCRTEHKRVFYPRCLDKNGNMEFFKVDCTGDLEISSFNLLEPKPTCKPYRPKENDIVIVPALSCDRKKYRIGYGGGYYDRFLKEFNGVSICPCYSEMLADTLPTDEYDIKISVVATDKEVLL